MTVSEVAMVHMASHSERLHAPFPMTKRLRYVYTSTWKEVFQKGAQGGDNAISNRVISPPLDRWKYSENILIGRFEEDILHAAKFGDIERE